VCRLIWLLPLLGSISLFVKAQETSLIQADLLITYDASSVLDGGVDTGGSHRALAQSSLNFDTSGLLLASQSSLFISAQLFRGDDGSLDAGDLQAYSNIDAQSFSKINEYWYQQTLSDDLRFKVGQIDATMGFSPTILSLPTYPDPALSINGFYTVSDLVTANVGIYSANGGQGFGDIFTIAELVVHYSDRGSLRVGGWHDSSDFEDLNGEELSGTQGYFALLDHVLPLSAKASSLGFFIQLGSVQNDLAAPRRHLGLGLVWHSPLGANATLGFGLSAMDLSSTTRFLVQNQREVATELFGVYALSDMLRLRPTVSYIVSPSALPNLDDALIFTLRTELEL
jgi:carbohydrate-selective porin OprB